MNVNLSNVSATSKTSVSESSAKAPTESSESKGFFETLAGVFTGSQKAEKAVTQTASTDAKTDVSATEGETVEKNGESQESVANRESVDGKAADALLEHEGVKAVADESEQTSESLQEEGKAPVVAKQALSPMESEALLDSKQSAQNTDSQDKIAVASAMGEGQQLLGRIEQANQALQTNDSFVDSGKGLPLQTTQATSFSAPVSKLVETDDAKALAALQSTPSVEQVNLAAEQQLEPILDANGKPLDIEKLQSQSTEWQNLTVPPVMDASAMQQAQANTSGALDGSVSLDPATVGFEGKAVQLVSIDELEVIDTKLAQGKPLSEQEINVIEGLRTGDVVADIPEQELAQLVALPTDVKAILAEQNTTQHNNVRNGSERTAATVAMGQQAQYVNVQEMKHAAAQAPIAQHADKLASAPMPDALVANNFNPAVQMAANGEVSHKAINAALSAGALKATASLQDKPESQYGLAGQLQAAAGQQGVAAQQQTRAEAAQQAQLPLQLTKELANEQVAEKVQMMMSKNLKNLDIRLDPPELGRMQIRMTMNNDLANVHFTVTNPQARDIIEQTLPRLREMLAQQGMQLADSSVQQQSSGQQQSGYAAAEQHGQGTSGRGFSGQSDENFDADVNLDLNVVSKRDGISFYA
ncbi:TPA: flagellar hook-length control protein FliK [Vibrio parahaemolyticus]|uniref:flagellar hook-length control protein FliK n=1 Tax=Vibrio parahaemolyticus TaxID=670 RepID=UPI0004065B98|nr:flagellar hook-length control protein FliK [Vibrio parahaemolyticus]KIT48227.1 flagellar hook-length control protein FliK [Vibrio parahaemolyticus EN9701121]EGQ7911429.1 flagellar hook-length control protein FliK [Vibrio parahaemolyticus]EGQ9861576.1 flagellar hook-length control protein FliK [Vibrio parahaemolyticus]EGW0142258.1 flagellar hook-length control protein FliK [Vibrio parahaemolyticus]EHB9907869.1 flagellar hook-length control protein FliK [Vibrio parahaemolyticus]